MQAIQIRIITIFFYFSVISLSAQKVDVQDIQQLFKKTDAQRKEGNYELAINNYLSIYPQIMSLPDSSFVVSQFYHGLSVTFNILGAKEVAIKYEKQAYTSEKKANAIQSIAMSAGQIATFYLNTAQYDSAMRYFQEGLNLQKKSNEPYFLVGAYNNMGMIKFRIHSPTAKAYYDTALFLIQKHNFTHNGIFASVNDNLAELYIAEKDYTKALSYCTIIEEWLIGRKNDHRRMINVSLKKAECLWKIGQIPKALLVLANIKPLFIQDKFFELEKQYYRLHIQIFEQQQQYAIAFAYQTQLNEYIEANIQKREALVHEAMDKMANMRFVLFQKELATAEIENSSAQKKLFFIIFLAGLFMLIGYLFYNRRIKWQKKELFWEQQQKEIALENLHLQKENAQIILAKEKIERENAEISLKTAQLEKENIAISLAYRKKELENMITYFAEGREWNETLLERIKEAKNLKEKEQENCLHKMMIDIKNRLSVDEKISFVHENINILNQEFYVNLREKYPTISPTELELCAYFNMNLSNKDIAVLRNVSIKAVQIARYRLRKKLNIEPHIDIYAFLQTL